jgi:hypothetical protein
MEVGIDADEDVVVMFKEVLTLEVIENGFSQVPSSMFTARSTITNIFIVKLKLISREVKIIVAGFQVITKVMSPSMRTRTKRSHS